MKDSPVVLITGASSGIGEASARMFASQGYQVVLAARRMERLENLSAIIRSNGGTALPVKADMRRLGDINELIQIAIDYFGKIDVLVNNAGFGRIDWLDRLEPEEDIIAQIEVNLLGVILMTRVVLPYMIERRKGHIINMSSTAGLVGSPTYTGYSASKFGVRGFSEALRREVSIYGIHVSVLFPGGVQTEFTQHAKINRKTGATTPASMRLTAEDVARAIFSLCKKPRRTLIIPWQMRFVFIINALFPGLVDRTVERYFVKPERL